ncbi:MAG: ankyrin repeat domain-containing protein [Flavobacterium sp.]|nr:MAG: ankyrin repeat domain-containing protein [Flavobacterium sp.]
MQNNKSLIEQVDLTIDENYNLSNTYTEEALIKLIELQNKNEQGIIDNINESMQIYYKYEGEHQYYCEYNILLYAIELDYIDAAKLLISYGADFNAVLSDFYNNGLQYKNPLLIRAFQSLGLNHGHKTSEHPLMKFLKLLIEKKLNINAQDFEGDTILHYMALYDTDQYSYGSCISLLLKEGINININQAIGTSESGISPRSNCE